MKEDGFEPGGTAPSLYARLPDEEVVELSVGGDKAATEYILAKYKNLVRSKSRIYFLAGADKEDIVQEGMIGLFKAIRDFDSSKLSSFRTFADMCITRQIITAVKNSTRQKHMPLNSYVSLNYPVYEEESERTLAETLAERGSANPEDLFILKENIAALNLRVEELLSKLEKTVLNMYLSGKSYQEIAEELGRSPKSIDNALQRVKRKLEAYID